MKIKYFFFVLVLLRVGMVQAQDKIITVQNDTIHCRIVSISDGRIYYEQPESNGIVVGKSLPADQITIYYRNSNDNPVGYIQPVKHSLRNRRQHWRFGLQGGIGYMLASSDKEKKQLIDMGVNAKIAEKLCKDTDWGYSFGADIHYLFDQRGGIGIRYFGFYTAAHADITINTFDGINYVYTNMRKRIYVNFAGPSFYTQQWLDRSGSFKLALNIAVGYAHYRDEEEYGHPLLPNYLSTGSTFGGNGNVSFEYFPLTWLSVGFTTGYFGAWFGKMTIYDGYNKQTIKLKDYQLDAINASRLDLSLGIKVYL